MCKREDQPPAAVHGNALQQISNKSPHSDRQHGPSVYLHLASVLLPILVTLAQAADSSGYVGYHFSQRSALKSCRLSFPTDITSHHTGMRLDDDNLRLDRHTSKHPASRKAFQGNTPKTRMDTLGNSGTRGPSCYRLSSTIGSNDNQRRVRRREMCGFRTSSNDYVHRTGSGYKKESRRVWKAPKGLFSLYKMKEAGKYLSGLCSEIVKRTFGKSNINAEA